jgi:mono/diheme cytochrome c family protein
MKTWMPARLATAFAVLFALMFVLLALGHSPALGQAQAVKRGEYLVSIMDCSGCHTPGALAGKPDFTRRLAGSDIGFRVPGAGIVYPPNLTPDPETGLGRWTAEQILRAVKHGERPDGRKLIPIMPWPSYSALTAADGTALTAYLKSLPPIRLKAPALVKEGETPKAPYLDVVVPR